MPDTQAQTDERVLLELLYACVGKSPKDELVSEALLRERREEAAREAHRYE